MFNPNKIEEKLDKISIHMIGTSPLYNSKPLFDRGFRVQRHSIAQVAQANEHLEEVRKDPNRYDSNHQLILTAEEIRWIRNERAICRADFLYWATRYAFIIDWQGQLARFYPNLAQQIILDVFSGMEAEGIAILIQVLKARQLGVTTLSELIILWRTAFTPYMNSLIASSRPEKSTEMSQKVELSYQNLPWWLVPKIETYNVGELIGFDGQHSQINIRHGSAKSGMGRGSTVLTFHLSEVAEFLDPAEQIDAALLKAAHDNPDLIGILESTGVGREGWWYEKWNFNVRFWPQRQSRLCPIFLPWYLLRELYPTEAWTRAHPIPEGEPFLDITNAHAKRAEAYVASGENHIISETLGSNWEMPPEQKWFWQVTRNEHAISKTLHDFYRELCADDKEAFQSRNSQIFDAELLFDMHEACPMPYGVYGILAPQAEVPMQHQARPQDIDPNTALINIKADWSPTGRSHHYTLAPLLHRGAATFDPLGKIIMYEPPYMGEVYGLGVDTSYGLGQDRSVIEGIRKGSPEQHPGQAFEFASPDVNSFSLWPIVLALGTLYSTPVNRQLRQAKVVIEGAANGENVYNELKKRGWKEFHDWVRYDKKRQTPTANSRQLWYTTAWSRPLIMDMLLDAVNGGWFQVNSPWLVDELSELELIIERQKIMAASGKHDDRVMALAMILFAMHILETKRLDVWTQRERMNQLNPNVVYPSYNPGNQGIPPPMDGREDRLNSYNYRVINNSDPEASLLRGAGARLWTPYDEEEL